MPIKIPNDLPAVKTLADENIFVMTQTRAQAQDIRPLQILILNLMPTKIDTETQLSRILGNTPLQVEIELIYTKSHKAKNTSEEHLLAFYKTFDDIRAGYYDGMIITGAPVEHLAFEQVEYWNELCEIMEWTKTHVHSTFHICWGAQAGLYYHFGISKHPLEEKLFGVYPHVVERKTSILFRGSDDVFMVPHSRNTTVLRGEIEKVPELKILSSSEKAGVYAVSTKNGRQIFITGHSEYDPLTLEKEYLRDKNAGIPVRIPENYYINNDEKQGPIVSWRSHANLIYSNWLNYFVYQSTPYDIRTIPEYSKDSIQTVHIRAKAPKFGGNSLSDGAQFEKIATIQKDITQKRYVVVTAPGKRFADNTKVSDLFYEYAENSDSSILEKIQRIYNETATEPKMKIALLGYGVVGKGVYDIISKRDDMEVKYVFDRRNIPELKNKLTDNIDVILNDPKIDTVVELLGGIHPAFDFAKAALEHCKNVVTANKRMVASGYRELSSLAKEKDVALCYTAAVGGGIPWLVNLERVSRVSAVNEITGIINGTTNYILDAMHARKAGFLEVLTEAQELGYAETDPSSDIDGIDIRSKCVLSANIAFGYDLAEEEVPVFGIRTVNINDILNAERMGCTVKIFANAIRTANGVAIWVEPVFVPSSSMEAGIHGNFNLVTFKTDLTGKESFFGQGAGRYPTASNVVQDCIDIVYGKKLLYNETMDKVAIDNSLCYRYYVRAEEDAFLQSVTEEKGKGYVITRPISVAAMHVWAKNREKTSPFLASIRV